jgi:hypothetical protein
VPDRRESRFALEVLFLVALAVAVTVADLRAVLIAGVMALGWLVVTGIEWASWRDEPHYGSGLPPRWYVPRVDLPPPQPLEPVVSGYPDGHRDEAPTWIASAALREEVLGDWPLARPLGPAEDEEEIVEEAWTAVALPPAAEAEPEPETAPEPEPEAARQEEPAQIDAALVRSVRRTARHSLDPLAEPAKRRFGRAGEEPPTIEVPERPQHRALPRTYGGEEA